MWAIEPRLAMSRYLIFALTVAVCLVSSSSGLADPTDGPGDFPGDGRKIGGSDTWAKPMPADARSNKARRKGETGKRTFEKGDGSKASKQRKKGASSPRKKDKSKKGGQRHR